MKRRVIFCTYPSIYSDIVLTELLKSDDIDVVGAVLSTRILNKRYSRLYASWCQIRRSGLRYASYLLIITDLYKILRFCTGKPTLRQYLRQSDIPVLETKDINDEQGLAFLKSRQADVMLSAHFNQLVGAEILAMDEMACINIHPSLLPAYKGVDPAFFALLRGEQQVGVSVHFQAAEFDAGCILEQVRVAVSAGDSLMGLNLKLFRQGAYAAIRQVKAMSVGIEQIGKGNYDSWPAVGEVRKFRRSGKLFKWRELIEIV